FDSPWWRRLAPARAARRAAARAGRPAARQLRSSGSAVKRAQADFLPSVDVEVLRCEPALEGALARRPFAVEHGKPGIVAVATFGDQMLAERAFISKAIAQRGRARGGVERIAFPLVAAVAERLEGVAREQILRLGAERRALQRRRIEHVADFDDAVLGADFHQREIADGVAGRTDDG